MFHWTFISLNSWFLNRAWLLLLFPMDYMRSIILAWNCLFSNYYSWLLNMRIHAGSNMPFMSKQSKLHSIVKSLCKYIIPRGQLACHRDLRHQSTMKGISATLVQHSQLLYIFVFVEVCIYLWIIYVFKYWWIDV